MYLFLTELPKLTNDCNVRSNPIIGRVCYWVESDQRIVILRLSRVLNILIIKLYRWTRRSVTSWCFDYASVKRGMTHKAIPREWLLTQLRSWVGLCYGKFDKLVPKFWYFLLESLPPGRCFDKCEKISIPHLLPTPLHGNNTLCPFQRA